MKEGLSLELSENALAEYRVWNTEGAQRGETPWGGKTSCNSPLSSGAGESLEEK